MDGVLTAVVVAVVAGVGLLSIWSSARAMRDVHTKATREWAAVAARHGLSNPTISGSPYLTFEGQVNTMKVTASGWDEGRRQLVITIEAPDLLVESLAVRLEDHGVEGLLERYFTGHDVEVGDPDFDREVRIHGNPVVLTALLDAPLRFRLKRAVVHGCRIEAGRLTMITEMSAVDAVTVDRALTAALDLAESLRTPDNPVSRLARNALSDPLLGVRVHNLDTLTGSFSDAPETRAAIEMLVRDAEPAIRRRAAAALGPVGRPVLEALAADPDVPDAEAAHAVRTLGPSLGLDRLFETLAHAVTSQRDLVAVATIDVIGLIDGEATSTTAAGLQRQEALAAAAVAGGSSVGVAAASALADCGTVAAVAPLRAAMSAHPRDTRLRQAALAAIAAIKERAIGAAPGSLALAGGEAGQLALSDGEGGELALSDDAAGTTEPT